MPRYFFDIDNHKHVNDDDGTDLPDDEEARVQAIIFAGDYLSDHPGIARHGAQFRVAVRNDQGRMLLSVVVMVDEAGQDPGPPHT
ncbi:hypothetical protein HMP09_2022 [Sphingomonas sp. HMP9]|uniref:DUF6894 family protein n=1 Tax=Sphingomonas sp. HMP9 TaxID=1517554 RepID=UPI001596BD21|nr:hypothetical protein [Sphingomonas sp. HMP9]BCA62788.1 hypothetical protein HMP09_2022 [Sphingomonas sp. HMP9]